MPVAKKKTPYEVLGVPADASKEAVKLAYRKRARQTHPDTGGDREEFALVKRAYDTLTDDARRQRYDATGDDDEPRVNESNVVHSLLASCLLAAITNITNRGGKLRNKDVVDDMRKILRAALVNHDQNRSNFGESEAVIVDAIGRIKEPDGLLAAVLRSELAKMRQGTAMAKQQIADHEAALRYLNDCRFNFEKAAAGYASTATSSTGGLFFQVG